MGIADLREDDTGRFSLIDDLYSEFGYVSQRLVALNDSGLRNTSHVTYSGPYGTLSGGLLDICAAISSTDGNENSTIKEPRIYYANVTLHIRVVTNHGHDFMVASATEPNFVSL